MSKPSLSLGRPDYVDINPGTMGQVHRSLTGKLVAVTDDVQGVARALHGIDPSLHIHYSPTEDLWVIMQEVPMPDGSTEERFVTSARELDHRIAHRVREVVAPGYDLIGEIEKAEREAQAAHDAARLEQAGDTAERLGHALRQDLSRHEAPMTRKSRAFIPGAFRPRT